MEKLISRDLLSGYSDLKSDRYKGLLNEAEERRESYKSDKSISVFLSHKHDEKEIVKQTVIMLKSLNVDIYLDWMDSGIPKNTNGFTAIRIKEKIREMDKFILLATEKAISSKWCNWELGYGDSLKYESNIAIMPITDSNDSVYSGNEYLQIYPVITSAYFYVSGTYYVEYNEKKIKLEEWLKRK